MFENIENLVVAVEQKSVESIGKVHQAYVAGYYESMLSQLAREIPEVAQFIERRVQYMNEQSAKKAA